MEEKKEFKSDTVTFTMERKPDCIIEYKVKVSPEIVQKARREAIRSIAKEVSLPGFRKGKAPDALIVKKFPDALKERWQKSIADTTFRECQETAKIPILSQDAQITFNVDKQSVEEGAELTYSFETEPEVPEIDIEKIELAKEERETIDAKKVDETIDQIRHYFAQWEKISDREVKKDDYVVVDVDVIEEDPPRKALTNTRFQVNRAKMAKWMFDLALGMKIGDSKEGVSIPDEDAPEEHKEENPPKKVRLTLRTIEKALLPDIDDELAKKVGVATAKEMRENLEKLLNKQADDLVQKAYREQINEYLIENCKFDLPKSLLQKETQYRIKQLVSDPQFQRKLMSMSEEERKESIQDVERQGERAVRLFYIARKIIQDQNIQISPSEVHKGVNTPLEAMFSDQSDLYTAHEQSQEQRAIAMSRLVLVKAEDYLISQAKIGAPKPKKKAAPKAKKEEQPKAEKEEEKKVAPKKKTAAPKKEAKAAPKKTADSKKKAAPKKKTDKS